MLLLLLSRERVLVRVAVPGPLRRRRNLLRLVISSEPRDQRQRRITAGSDPRRRQKKFPGLVVSKTHLARRIPPPPQSQRRHASIWGSRLPPGPAAPPRVASAVSYKTWAPSFLVDGAGAGGVGLRPRAACLRGDGVGPVNCVKLLTRPGRCGHPSKRSSSPPSRRAGAVLQMAPKAEVCGCAPQLRTHSVQSLRRRPRPRGHSSAWLEAW